MKVHYIVEYGSQEEGRRYSPAGAAKMNYLIHCMDELGFDYKVFATSQTISPKVTWGGD